MNKKKTRRGIRARGEAGKVTFDLFLATYATVCVIAGAGMADGLLSAIKETGCQLWHPTTEEVIQAEAQTTQATQVTSTTTTEEAEGMDVPSGDTAFKSYMSYKAITNTDSYQYKLQKRCWTDANGLRRYKTFYVVALGSYYAEYIGQTFHIKTTDGNEFDCVVGDFKADRHTDSLHQYTPMDPQDGSAVRKCVVEFVVDTGMLDKTAKHMGDISYIEGFSGNIQEIVCREEVRE